MRNMNCQVKGGLHQAMVADSTSGPSVLNWHWNGERLLQIKLKYKETDVFCSIPLHAYILTWCF